MTTSDNLTLCSLQKTNNHKEIQKADIVIEMNENQEMVEEMNEKAESNENDKQDTDSGDKNSPEQNNKLVLIIFFYITF